MSVKAKFTCNSIVDNPWGGKTAHFNAVYGQEGENKDYADATPSGNLSLVISDGRPAAEYFQQGENYYLTIEKAPAQ